MMKKIAKSIASLLLVVIITGSGFIAHEWYGKPWFINNFFNREAIKISLTSPELLSTLHVLENIGIRGHNSQLDDASLAANEEMLQQFKAARTTLESYSDDSLDEGQRLSKAIAMYLANSLDDYETFQFHDYPVNQLFGVQNGFPSFMESTHLIEKAADADDYVARLGAVTLKFDQVLEGLKKREQLGILPPRFVVERVLDEMNSFVTTPVKENILYTSMKSKLEDADVEPSASYLSATEQAIKQQVYPAYQQLIKYFETLKEKTTTDDGYWKLPNGDAAYAAALRSYTTTDYSADEIHLLGLSEVDRIQAEILTILKEQDYDISQGFSVAIEALAAKPEFYYPDTEEGRQQILKDYQGILDEINQGLDEVFAIRPKGGVEVRRIPAFKEKTAPGAYYQPPAIDGSRAGMFFANLYDIKATPKYSMRTLAYHEGVPGHHFQVSINMQLEGVPLFRRAPIFTAYTEGWALYAESLAWELGFQDDPYDNIGRLQAELFRAVRLVVDTGIHAKHWTREQAIDYMKTNTGMAQSDVVAEIERYIVMPGQATSYKIGMMKILELRAKAKTALAEEFSLRDFHDVVLRNGAVPLTVLEQLVEDYIEKTKASAS